MHNNTIISQLLKVVSRHEFERLALRHNTGQGLRKISRWAQFVSMTIAHISNRFSIRDLITNMAIHNNLLYHLGIRLPTRSTFSRINEQQPYTLYEELFYKLLGRIKKIAPSHKFRFKNKLSSFDTTTIDLCLSVFPWADFRKTKGGIKLHVQMDHGGMLPEFIRTTTAKVHESQVAKSLKLPKGSIIVFDKAMIDFEYLQNLTNKGIFFVTRLKSNMSYYRVRSNTCDKRTGVSCDQTIRLNGSKWEKCPDDLRRVGYRDMETGKKYYFLTNNFKLSAKTIANIYKERWQIELFFKCIKQNLKIKTFLGTSKNAVLTQLWIAMIIYLMISFLKFKSFCDKSIGSIIRALQINLMAKKKLLELFNKPPDRKRKSCELQMSFL